MGNRIEETGGWIKQNKKKDFFCLLHTKHSRSTKPKFLLFISIKKKNRICTTFHLAAPSQKDLVLRYLSPRRDSLFAQLQLQPLNLWPVSVLQPHWCWCQPGRTLGTLGDQCSAPARGVFPSVLKRFNDMPGEGRFMHVWEGLCISTDLYSARCRNLWKEGINVLLISKKTCMMDVLITHFFSQTPFIIHKQMALLL